MGVSFRHCNSCKESLYDEHVGSCTDCGNSLCTNCLINDDIKSRFAYQYGIRFDSTNEKLVAELLNDSYITKDENGDYDIEEGELIDDSAIQPKYCPFCQGNTIDNDSVLVYLLQKYNLNINDVWLELKNK